MKLSEETDEQLLAIVARRQPLDQANDALTILYDRYSSRIRQLVTARVNAKDVDDILQESWRKILSGADKFSGGSFLAWAFTITKRNIIDFYRKTGRRKESAFPEDDLQEPVEAGTAADAFEVKEDCEILKNCLKALGERERAVVTARSRSVAHEQIAVELAITNENARKLWFRAKAKIKDCFESKLETAHA